MGLEVVREDEDLNEITGIDFSGFVDFNENREQGGNEGASSEGVRGRHSGYNRLFNGAIMDNSQSRVNSDRNIVDNSRGDTSQNSNNSYNRMKNKDSSNNRNKTRVGTWNVRTMSQNGKFEDIEEINRMKIGVCGLSEVRWMGAGKTEGGKFNFILLRRRETGERSGDHCQ